MPVPRLRTTRARARRGVRGWAAALTAALLAVLVPPATGAAPSQAAAPTPPPPVTTPAFHTTAAGGPGTATAIRSWQIQSSAVDVDGGDALSQPGYATHGWYVAPARSTVMAAMLADGLYPDVF